MMKNKMISAVMAVTIACMAAAEESPVETLAEAVAESGWTAQELITALNLMEAKYNRDVSNETGRIAWHGRRVRESVDTNTLTKVTTYEDGTRFTDPAKLTTALMAVREANAKLPRPTMTNGVPVRLANARLRQAENRSAVSNVTVTVGGN